MSYDLAVWDEHRTIDAATAYSKYLEFIEGQDAGPKSHHIDTLYADLTSIYPELDDDNEDECPWAATIDRGPSHLIFAITAEHARNVFSDILRLATANGLLCFDPQTMEILSAVPNYSVVETPVTLRSIRSRVIGDLADALTKLGFVKMQHNIFLRPIRDDWSGWLGINRSDYRDSFSLNPVVGVRSIHLERTVSKLKGASYSNDHPPSLSTTLIRLLGPKNWNRWSIAETASLDEQNATVDDLVEQLTALGIPYMEQQSNLEILSIECVPRPPDAHGNAYRYPVVLFMVGRAAEAVAFVSTQLESFPVSYDSGTYYDQYKAFAARFFEFVANGSPCTS